jgi:predicted nucleic acid-binding protein
VIFYFDSSVVLRILLGEPNPLQGWETATLIYASALLPVEVLRTLDRLTITRRHTQRRATERVAAFAEMRRAIRIQPVSDRILAASSQRHRVVVNALDAIHVATALAVRETEPDVVFVTHDKQQAVAATALGLVVQGV